jgi:hypothetical protein
MAAEQSGGHGRQGTPALPYSSQDPEETAAPGGNHYVAAVQAAGLMVNHLDSRLEVTVRIFGAESGPSTATVNGAGRADQALLSVARALAGQVQALRVQVEALVGQLNPAGTTRGTGAQAGEEAGP